MKNAAAIVILGLGDDKKPRAAKFDASQINIVRNAAKAMGLRVGHPKTDEAKALADRLIPGKLFATGKGLVPLVKTDTYQLLSEKLELEPEASSSANKPAEAAKTPKGEAATPAPETSQTSGSRPLTSKLDPGNLWEQLKVGDRVIAMESQDLGWWPAVISSVAKDGKLKLRWLDSKQPEFTAKRQAVALLYRSACRLAHGLATAAPWANLHQRKQSMPSTAKIRALNDAFRTSFISGKVLITPGIGF